jgi:iron complex outermembrane receptor protein
MQPTRPVKLRHAPPVFGLRRGLLCVLACPGVLLAAGTEKDLGSQNDDFETMVVTASGASVSLLELAGNTTRIDGELVELNRPTHSSEILQRVPGTWINRGSGQELLPAIRSPILTGAGSCGAFLVAENGFPIRPSGFCNVNQLFEVNLEQADAVEVVRGPGSSLYGSNAMHGLVNVFTGEPGTAGKLSLEAGQDNYWRFGADLGDSNFRGLFNLLDDGGWRDQESVKQQKINLGYAPDLAEDNAFIAFAATNLDQQTAGYIYGYEAYKDRALSRQNLNPEAFREADAQRLSGRWSHAMAEGAELESGIIIRRSEMEFLQHYLPGKPLERNGQHSIQAGLAWRQDLEQTRLALGLDLELAQGFLWEYQENPIEEGSDYLIATRPAGMHYDYEVNSRMASPYLQVQQAMNPRTTISFGLRLESLSYHYDNKMLDGNTDQDGQPCGYDGCLYTRPVDRNDHFSSLAPKLGLTYRLDDQRQLYVSANRGFRAPQATELYRLQSQQDFADLDSEILDALELGYRSLGPGHYLELVAYNMNKQNTIYRDNEGFNISDAQSRHYGLELDYQVHLTERWKFGLSGSWARHLYASDYQAPQGEQIISGNEIDGAPNILANARLSWNTPGGTETELEWQHVGGYFLDASNSPAYPGHDVLNLRLRQKLGSSWSLGLRLINLTDSAYAERSDFAFGAYRYFPGRDRTLYADITYYPVWRKAGRAR